MSQLQAVRTLDTVAAEIRTFTASMLNNVIEIGRRMVEAKEMVPYGEWGSWIKDKTGYSVSTAENFMRLFREYGAAQGCLFGAETESQSIGKLSYTKALALLALPAEERESFAETVGAEGMSTAELKQAIKERNEAISRAEKAEQNLKDQLEEQQTVYDIDMAEAEGKLEETRQKLDAALEREQQARKELEELKLRPVEVAVQEADPAELEKARKEGEAAARKKLEKAMADARKAEAERKKLEERVETLKKDVQAARQEAAAAEGREKEALARVEQMARKANLAGDKDMVSFSLFFEESQTLINKMDGILKKMTASGRVDEVTKLRMAMGTLADAVARLAKGG